MTALLTVDTVCSYASWQPWHWASTCGLGSQYPDSNSFLPPIAQPMQKPILRVVDPWVAGACETCFGACVPESHGLRSLQRSLCKARRERAAGKLRSPSSYEICPTRLAGEGLCAIGATEPSGHLHIPNMEVGSDRHGQGFKWFQQVGKHRSAGCSTSANADRSFDALKADMHPCLASSLAASGRLSRGPIYTVTRAQKS